MDSPQESLEKNATLLTPWCKPSDNHFRLLTSRTVR